jgi:hypothetical protein
MYLTNQGIEDSMTIDFLAASIRPVAGMIGGKVTEGYSGEALANYRTLVQTAVKTDFKLAIFFLVELTNNKFYLV